MATVWNNASTTPASFSDVKESGSSGLVRLVEDPDVKKTIKFDELSLNYYGTDSAHPENDQSKITGTIYPVVRINDVEFASNFISHMSISSSGFFPTISLEIVSNTSDLISKSMPKDGDIISTFIRTNTDALNYLRNDFIITSCNVSLSKFKNRNTITLQGKLFVPGFESDYNLFALIGSSRTVCKEISKKFGIGFAFNDFEDTNDFQNWICSGRVDDFVNDVTSHAWKNNISFFNSWIDLYYNLCFVNTNKFLLSDNKEDIDITFASNVAIYQATSGEGNGETKETAKGIVKMLSNSLSFRGTPFFISDWSVTNNSGISLKAGYVDESYVFIHNQNLISSDQEKCFSMLNNISAYDKAKMDSYMILRGRTTYDPSTNTNEKARVNYDLPNMYINRTYAGVEYTMSDDTDVKSTSNDNWSGNVHKNYLRAPIHNSINQIELNKLYLTVETDGLCIQIMRGERVPVMLMQEYGMNSATLDDTKTNTSEAAHRMYCGYYIVDSIQYKYNPKRINNPSGKFRSAFSTVMTLKRREWPTPEETQKD